MRLRDVDGSALSKKYASILTVTTIPSITMLKNVDGFKAFSLYRRYSKIRKVFMSNLGVYLGLIELLQQRLERSCDNGLP